MSSQENLPPETEDQQEGNRRYLIATGTAQYEHLPDDLPSVEEDLRRIHRLLCEEGTYQRSIEDLGEDLALNPDSGEIRAALDEWFSAEDRTLDDVAVVYYTGHGGVEGGSGTEKHYLLTRDSQPNLFTTTALPAEEIARYIEKSSLRRVLLLLDTCFAGYGSGDITKNLSKLRDFFSEKHVHVSIIAASWPKGEAYEGAFTEALSSVLDDPSWAGDRQRYVPLDSIRAGINQHFEKKGLPQTAVHHGIATGSEHPPFFRNPRHEPHLPEGIDLREQRRIRSMDPAEARLHWEPRGRGVEIDTQPGWYFTGRKAILEELVEWLERPAERAGARVITGPPGIGKSAVLARLVTLADPEFRDRAPLEDFDSSVIPPVGSIDVAVHAKKKTLPDIAQSISRAMGKQTTDPDSLVQLLENEEDSFTIILDALDEANDPEIVSHDLLRRLTPLSSVRLLVGAREGPIQALGPRVEVKDLDDPEYRSRSDLVSYAKRRLLARDEPTVETPYRDRPDLADRVASIVAEKADPIFLIARLICEDLIDAEEVVDPDDSEWRKQLPESVSGAFEEYLGRFGTDEFKIRDLLRPVAYAQGNGLPWENLWAPLASALSPHNRSYTDEDVAWVLEEASSYLVEDLLEGRSVYRLYHQAFVDFFHDEGRDRELHRQITEALAASVPDLEKGGGKDWRQAHPYVRHHLSTHAAAGGVLSDLVADPMYLAAADPSRLAAAFGRSSEGNLGRGAEAFQLTIHNLRGKNIEERLSYIELEARKRGASSFVERARSLPLDRNWKVAWAHWDPESTHRLLEGHTGSVHAVAMGTVKGRPVGVSGGRDGTVRVWALDSGECLRVLKGHGGSVDSVTVGTVEGRPVVVSGDSDGTVRVWALDSDESLHELEDYDGGIHTPEGGIAAVAVGTVEGRPVVVSGDFDGTVQIWALDSGECLREFEGHADPVTAVAVGTVEGRPVVVSGERFGTIRVWTLDSDESLQEFEGHDGPVYAIGVGTVRGCPVVFWGDHDGTVQVWDLGSGECLRVLKVHTKRVYTVAVGTVDGRPVVVSGVRDEMVQIWELGSGECIRELRGHDGSVYAVTVGTVEGRPMVVSGGRDGTVRVWAADSGDRLSEPGGQVGPVEAMAAGTVEGHPVVVSGDSDGTVRVWALDSDECLHELEDYDGGINTSGAGIAAVAVGTVEDRPVVVSGGRDGSVQVRAVGSGDRLGEPKGHADPVNTVALGTIEGRLAVVSGGLDGWVQVWASGSGARLRGAKGYRPPVDAVTVGTVEGRPVVVSGDSDGTVQIWNLNSGECLREFEGHADPVIAVAVGTVEDRPVVVSGDSDGTVRVWALDSDECLHELEDYDGGINTSGAGIAAVAVGTVEASPVEAVAVGKVEGHPVILSGGSDETVLVWDGVSGDQLLSINVDSHVNSLVAQDNRVMAGTARGLVAVDLTDL